MTSIASGPPSGFRCSIDCERSDGEGGRLTPARLLSAFYFSNYGALGAVMPFLPLLFEARGLSPTEIATVMFLVPLGSLIVPSFWGMLADALRARVLLLRIAALGATLALPLLYFDWKLAGCLFAMSFICFFRASVAPLADAAAHAMLEGRGSFASIRVWGSVGFAIFAAVAGWYDVSHHPGRMIALACSAYFASFLITLRMEAPPLERQPKVMVRTLRFLSSSSLPLLLAGTTFHYLGHSMFDVFFALHLRANGYDDAFIGFAWSVGAFSEVAMMFTAPRLLAAFDARRLMLISASIAIVRWFILSAIVDPVLIMLGQTLHAFTFGLWYVATVKFVQDLAPEELRTSLQSVAITAMGLGAMFGYQLGGVIFEAAGGRFVFLTAAAAATCATACYGVLATRRLERALS